jgi:hypothetical protein
MARLVRLVHRRQLVPDRADGSATDDAFVVGDVRRCPRIGLHHQCCCRDYQTVQKGDLIAEMIHLIIARSSRMKPT